MASRSSSSRVRWTACSTPGTGDRGDRGPREHLLGAAHVVPELPAVAPLRGVAGCGERLPGGRVGGGDDPAEVVDQRRVEVEAAELGHAARSR